MALKSLSDIESTLDKPIVTAGREEELVMVPEGYVRSSAVAVTSPPVRIHTVREYLRYKGRGYEPADNHQIAVESWFKTASVPAKYLGSARPSRVSYVKDLALSDRPLPLPPTLGPYLSRDEDARVRSLMAKGKSWREIWPKAQWSHPDRHTVSIEVGGLRTIVDLLAWGDFNGDGIEDVLLSVTTHATRATFHSYGHVIITRLSERGPIRIVRQDI